MCLIEQQSDDVCEPAVSEVCKLKAVESVIRCGPGIKIAGRDGITHRVSRGSQLRYLLARKPLSRQRRRALWLQDDQQTVDIAQIVDGNGQHAHAATRLDFDHSLLREPNECLVNRCPADVKPLGEFSLRTLKAGWHAVSHYLRFDPDVGRLGEVCAVLHAGIFANGDSDRSGPQLTRRSGGQHTGAPGAVQRNRRTAMHDASVPCIDTRDYCIHCRMR